MGETAPYLHDGSAATLYDVLVTKNPQDKHGDVSQLTEVEIDQLVAFLLQLDESEDGLITGIQVKNKDKNNLILEVSPNPATESITVCFPFSSKLPGTLKVIKADNRKVIKEIQLLGTEELNLDVRNLSPAMYFIEYTNSEKHLTSKLVVQ